MEVLNQVHSIISNQPQLLKVEAQNGQRYCSGADCY